MTTTPVVTPGTTVAHATDRRGSWIPNGSMITTRILELRKRRGLMIALAVVTIGIPAIFLTVRLFAHAFDPKSFGPAGGYDVFSAIITTVYIFGFIVAATLGCTAGSVDLTEGMFRHLVITGRSRLALYFARIPAGLAIIVPMVAAGFAIVCAVCVFAAPTTLKYSGVTVPQGLSQSQFESWAVAHEHKVFCDFPSRNVNIFVPCGPAGRGQKIIGPNGGSITITPPTTAQKDIAARKIAREDYADYSSIFLSPPVGLMVDTGLWIELEAAVGFIVGLGLASLMGQRTVPVVLLMILELVLTPLLSMHVIPHLINVQRGLIGLATSTLEPHALPHVFGGGQGPGPNTVQLVGESRTVAVLVILGWVLGWTALGAWRMARRDA